jgi:hypothetical protein
MWRRRSKDEEIMENGRSPRQTGKKDAAGNRAIRMPKWPQLPRSTKQKENLSMRQQSSQQTATAIIDITSNSSFFLF